MRRDWLEEEGNDDRWMVSYADFITLLFAFFVVMYAISSVNDEKYRVLSDTLKEAFDNDAASLEPIQLGEPSLVSSPHVVDLPDAEAFADLYEGDTFIEQTPEEVPIPKKDPAHQSGFKDAEGVSLHSNNNWIEFNLDASLLFGAGSARLTEPARRALGATLETLRDSQNPITVEGYTDNVPASSTLYPSNWELSAARASAVARFYVEQGIRAERLTAVGYGENHPLQTNATPGGRDANRRVVVVLARDGNAARNLNGGQTSAVAVVRQAAERSLDDRVLQTRTPEGGLRFSNAPPEEG
ncbi:MAG: OmpA family protein [Pseudomonadota bacterium]